MVDRFVCYFRVSTDKQGIKGLGIEAQREAIRNYLALNGGEVVGSFEEVETGKKNDRPELLKAIEKCRRTKATLLIAKLDRLGRNLHFISGLMESGIEFRAVDNPHANKFMVHMLAAFAEHERELIAERTRNALQAAKERGVKLGLYGKVLAKQNKTSADQFAMRITPTISDIKQTGHYTVQQICNELNRRCIKTSRGNGWHISSTHNLLKRIEQLGV